MKSSVNASPLHVAVALRKFSLVGKAPEFGI